MFGVSLNSQIGNHTASELLYPFMSFSALVLPPKPECPWHLNFALSRKGCKDCPKDHICCVYNGEEVCVPTVFTKPGVCPRKFLLPSSSAFVPCVESCSYDSDCPDNEKCCSNGCAHECMAPYIGEIKTQYVFVLTQLIKLKYIYIYIYKLIYIYGLYET
uniref:WAP domain-containing protein n=1 Tax=Oreochromis niloticus TaxID=8128 RepID=A0A669CZK0_ORENI